MMAVSFIINSTNMETFLPKVEKKSNFKILPISCIAENLGIAEDELEPYGKYKAKLPLSLIDEDAIRCSLLFCLRLQVLALLL